jgi:hypothetical protein
LSVTVPTVILLRPDTVIQVKRIETLVTAVLKDQEEEGATGD